MHARVAIGCHQRRLVGTNWIGPRAHVTCYPVQRGEIFNFVGQVDRTDWSAEGWFHEGSKEECHADFPNWHPEVKMMIEGSVRLFKTVLRDHLQVPQRHIDREVFPEAQSVPFLADLVAG